MSEQSGRDANHGYSSVYRLISENISGDPTSANNGGLTYSLDPVGNRLSLASTLAALSNQTNTYDPDDRLSGDAYDANGNTLTSGGNTFAYDFEDRLAQFDTSVQMAYDGDGNRIVRTQGVSTARYLVDDLTPTGYAQVAEEVVSGSVTAQYTYGSWRISQNRSAVLSYYGYDAGGSVRELFSDTGAATDTYDYDAFGNTVAQTGSTVNEFLYRGEQFDSTLGMYYLRARYYETKTGRFLTADKYEPRSPRTCNCSPLERRLPPVAPHHLFQYAGGDPSDRIDPTGRDDIFETSLIEDREVPGAADLANAVACGVSAVFPLADFLHQLFVNGRTFCPALRRKRFGPSSEAIRSFTPILLVEGQH